MLLALWRLRPGLNTVPLVWFTVEPRSLVFTVHA